MSENDIDNITKNLALTTLDDSKEVKLGNKEIIKKFIDIINHDFDHKLTPDKYNLADIFIRPKNVNGDWLRIAARYASSSSIISHLTNENISSYVLVYLTNTDRTWIIRSKDMIVKRIQIRLNMPNKYEEFEVKREDIIDILKKYYKTCRLVEDTNDTKYFIANHDITHNKFDFDEIVSRFAQRNCIVVTTRDEFTTEKMNTKTKMKVTMSCEHEDVLTLNAFQKRKHSVCQKCIYKELTKNSYNEIEQVSMSNFNEATSFEYIKTIFKNDFEIQKTHEGCKSDMILKPLDITEDKWLGIQLKTMICTKTINQYHFPKIGKYPNIVIVCIAMPINKMWVFDGNDLLGKTGLSIGINESKYDKNEVFKEDLVNLMKTKYEIYHKYSLEDLNIPTGISQQTEHTNRLFREQLMNNQFTLEYPKIDGTKYDIIINNCKVQDKCARKVTDKNSYYVTLYNGNYNKITYKLCDNDYYWINMPDGNFYIIPEAILLDDQNNIVKRITLNKVYEKYYFEYDDPNIIQKLKKIFL